MCSHEIKYCPRCNQPFECKVGNILLCQCNNIRLTEHEQSYLEKKYNDCLCIVCLEQVRQELRDQATSADSGSGNMHKL